MKWRKDMERDKIDFYYMYQLNQAILYHKNKEYAQVQFIRAELHTVNLFLFIINFLSIEEFNGIEIFVNDMLGGKKDVGIRYQ